MTATQVQDQVQDQVRDQVGDQAGDHRDATRCTARSGKDRHAWVRWAAGAAAAIVVHGVAAAMLLHLPDGTVAFAPTATIVVELSPVMAAPVVLAAPAPPTPQQVQADTPAPRVMDKTIDAPPEVVADEADPEVVEPRLAPTPETTPARPRPTPREDDAPNLGPPSPPPLPAQQAEVEPVPPHSTQSQSTRIDEPRLEPAAAPGRRPATPSKPPKPAPGPPQPHQPAPEQAASRPHPADSRRANLQAPAASTPSNADALPTWKSQIIGILERNKRYPPAAKARDEHGVSNLAFTLNRQGRVTSAHIAGTSGSAALDAETLALVHRVQPFPPPPPEVAGTQIGFVVAMRYY